MSRKTRSILLLALAITMLAVPTLIVFSKARRFTSPPLPNPNGYDDFLRAATRLLDDKGNAWRLGREELRGFNHDRLVALVSTNAESLRLLRLGFTRQYSVPTDSAVANSIRINEVVGLYLLSDLLAAQGRLREMENQPAEAALSYVDCIRLGNGMSRGGFLFDRFRGIACEHNGWTSLAKVIPKLDGQQAQTVLTELMTIEDARVSWEEIQRNTARWNHCQHGNRFNPIIRATLWWKSRPEWQMGVRNHKLAVAMARLLEAELALRCYQSRQGVAPASLDALVTNYLIKVPQDPFSGRPLIYGPQAVTNWLLYSIGPDGVDDRGKPVGRWISGTVGVGKGDLFYDSQF